MSSRDHKLKMPQAALIGTIILWALLLALTALANGNSSNAQFVGNESCAMCHDEISEAFSETIHGVGFSMDDSKDGVTCESCHGPGSVHAEEMDPESIFNPADASQFDGGNEYCTGCHNSSSFDDWAFSSHHNADINCSECHKVHTEPGEKMTRATPDLCYDCHSDIRAAFYMPSRHPVREGKMDCRDCHGIHGGEAEFTQDYTTRELCFSCHPEKEGPFVYEHAPVSEDCMSCHTPHGAVANNLLVQQEPVLCLNCHPMHFHATVEGVEGTFVPPQAPERTSVSTHDAWKKGMLTKCTQCHTEVHGSDLPSQAISTGGNALTR